MMNSELFDYLDLKVDDPIQIKIELPNILPGLEKDTIPKALNFMANELAYSDKPKFNWERRTMTVDSMELDFNAIFGNDTNSTELSLNSTAKQGFENSYGKFPVAYGNVVILDFNFIFDTIIDSAKTLIVSRFESKKITKIQEEAALFAIEELK